jgi:hypothetical protein
LSQRDRTLLGPTETSITAADEVGALEVAVAVHRGVGSYGSTTMIPLADVEAERLVGSSHLSGLAFHG